LDIIIEYLVQSNLGEVSLRIVYSKNPARALSKYYEYERRVRSWFDVSVEYMVLFVFAEDPSKWPILGV